MCERHPVLAVRVRGVRHERGLPGRGRVLDPTRVPLTCPPRLRSSFPRVTWLRPARRRSSRRAPSARRRGRSACSARTPARTTRASPWPSSRGTDCRERERTSKSGCATASPRNGERGTCRSPAKTRRSNGGAPWASRSRRSSGISSSAPRTRRAASPRRRRSRRRRRRSSRRPSRIRGTLRRGRGWTPSCPSRPAPEARRRSEATCTSRTCSTRSAVRGGGHSLRRAVAR